MLGARKFIHRMIIIIFLSTSLAAPAFGDGGDPSSYPWWTSAQTHDDARLLVQKISWDKCLKVKKVNNADRVTAMLWREAPSPEDEVRLGLELHIGDHAFRQETWDKIFGVGRHKKEYTKSFGLSIIPYIEKNGNKHHLLPHDIFRRREFNSYVPSCKVKIYQTKFRSTAHYHPTVFLTPSSSSPKLDFFKIFRDRSGKKEYDLIQPLSIQYKDLPRRMDRLLRLIWQEAVARQRGFVTLNEDGAEPSLTIEASGFGKPVSIQGIRRDRTCQLNPLQIVQGFRGSQPAVEQPEVVQPRVAETGATQPGALPEATPPETTPPETTQPDDARPRAVHREPREEPRKKFSISFSKKLKDHFLYVRSLKEYLKVPVNCLFESDEDMRFQIECPGEVDEVRLQIDGFRSIDLEQRSSGNQELDESDLVAEIKIENTSRSAYRFEPRKGESVDIPGGETKTLELSIATIKSQIHFKPVEDTRYNCEISKKIYVRDILAKRATRINAPCWDVASWPTAWGRPEGPGIIDCGKANYAETADSTALTCLKQGGHYSPLKLSWGRGWERQTFLRNDAPSDVASDFRPKWPFAQKTDQWLVPAASQVGSGECAKEPRYRIASLTYKGSVEKSALNPDSILESWQLPSLQDVEWPRDQSLPEEVLITLEQIGPISQRYRRSHRTSWRITDFENRSGGTLTEANKEDLRTTYQIHAPDRPLRPYSNNLKFYAFEDQETCENSAKYSELAGDFRFYVQEQLQAMNASLCSYGRLVEDATYEAASPCVRARLIEDQNELEFQFELPSECPGERRLLIISLAEEIEGIGGSTIQDQILEAFSQILSEGQIPTFDLVTLGGGSNFNSVLDCERLPLMRRSGSRDSLRGQIDQIRFAGKNMRSLSDLNRVSRRFRGTPVSKILYLTASQDLLNKRAEDLDISEFNAATYWYSQSIEFNVLTMNPGTCSLWQGEPRAHSCEEWNRDTDLSTIIKKFLTE